LFLLETRAAVAAFADYNVPTAQERHRPRRQALALPDTGIRLLRVAGHAERQATLVLHRTRWISMAGGGIVLAAMLLGAIRLDPAAMAAAIAALLGGIVVWGSNGSTAKEAARELAAAEADRAALIETINLRVVP
jgi:hypothetical protein